MNAHKSLLRVNDSVYILDRVLISEFTNTPEKVDAVKQWLGSTHVFTNNVQTFFCSEIEEAVIIEEIIDTPPVEIITQFRIVHVETIYPEITEEAVAEDTVEEQLPESIEEETIEN